MLNIRPEKVTFYLDYPKNLKPIAERIGFRINEELVTIQGRTKYMRFDNLGQRPFTVSCVSLPLVNRLCKKPDKGIPFSQRECNLLSNGVVDNGFVNELIFDILRVSYTTIHDKTPVRHPLLLKIISADLTTKMGNLNLNEFLNQHQIRFLHKVGTKSIYIDTIFRKYKGKIGYRIDL